MSFALIGFVSLHYSHPIAAGMHKQLYQCDQERSTLLDFMTPVCVKQNKCMALLVTFMHMLTSISVMGEEVLQVGASLHYITNNSQIMRWQVRIRPVWLEGLAPIHGQTQA